MLNEEFIEEYNGAAYTLEEFADGAEQVTDNDSLRDAAKMFRMAQSAFESELDFNGIELG